MGAMLMIFFGGALACVYLNRAWVEGRTIVTEPNVVELAVSKDGKFVASASNNERFDAREVRGTVTTYSLESGKSIIVLRHPKPIRSLSFSPDGSLLATGSEDGLVRVWNSATGALKGELCHAKPVCSVRFSPDGLELVTTSEDGIARIWNREMTLLRVKVLDQKDDYPYSKRGWYTAEFSDNGQSMVSISAYTSILIWDVLSLKDLMSFQDYHKWPFGSALFMGSKRIIAYTDGIVCLDVPTGRIIWQRQAHVINSLRVSEGKDRLVAGNHDRATRIFDAYDGTELAVLRRRGLSTGPVESEFDPEEVSWAEFVGGDRIVSGEADGRIIVWERCFPEWWWGLFVRPDVWLASVFGALWLWRVSRWIQNTRGMSASARTPGAYPRDLPSCRAQKLVRVEMKSVEPARLEIGEPKDEPLGVCLWRVIP